MPEMTRDRLKDFLSAGTRTAMLATTRRDGRPHIAPVWFILDGDDVIFMTGRQTVKGRTMLRDPRVTLGVDDPTPPFAFAMVEGEAEYQDCADAPEESLAWSTRIAARYMGEERAEEFGRRNAVPGELVVRVRPTHVVSNEDLSG